MLDAQGKIRKVAIACQGGGSHTASTAGVLKRLLQAEELKQHEVVGLSGTSGGAVCALLAWHNLLRGDAAGAAEALAAFWRDNSATAPHEQIINSWVLWASSLQNFITMPVVSPYYDNYFSVSALEEFKRMLERRVDFTKVGLQPEDSYPVLLVGAVDVLSGEFRAFNSRRDRITSETILASAAIPTLFRSVRPGDGGPTGTDSSRRSFTRSLTFTPYAPLPETGLAPPGATPVRETPGPPLQGSGCRRGSGAARVPRSPPRGRAPSPPQSRSARARQKDRRGAVRGFRAPTRDPGEQRP